MSYYDPRGRTPAGRAEQLAEMAAGIEARDRREADLANGPGGTVSDIFAKMSHWERRAEEAEHHWDAADRTWRDLVVDGGKFPSPLEAGAIAGALADRDRLSEECSRVKASRDGALAEFEQIRRPDWR